MMVFFYVIIFRFGCYKLLKIYRFNKSKFLLLLSYCGIMKSVINKDCKILSLLGMLYYEY